MATSGIEYLKKKIKWGPRDPAYTLKKLHEALEDYENCIGITEVRLYDAWLSIHLLTPNDFPEEMQPRFQELVHAMTCRPDPTPDGMPGRIGDARNTLKGMHPEDCKRILTLLTGLIHEVEASLGLEIISRSRPATQNPYVT